MKIKRYLSLIMTICMVFSMLSVGFVADAAETQDAELSANNEVAQTGADTEIADTGANLYGLADNVQDGQILQCWLWSYNNISKNLQKIAEQGFSAIQVSPIQPIKESTSEYYNTFMNSSWVIYQPVAFSIEDNYRNVQGTKKEFKAMCEKAHKYGIKVIVDTVFNHMANDMSGNTIHPWVPSELRDNSDCWHDITKNISNYDDRYQTTQYCLTGLPDLNTSNSIVQKHCINFMKEAIDAGADGFRFDAVKHIETPSDRSSFRSNFWPNVLNAATEYAQETRGFTPYYYGELLGSPGSGLSISAYTKYMSVSDPGSSDSIRNAVCNGNASQAASGSISNGAAKNKAVQWTESHDNHKDNGTADISEHNINKTWAIIGAKDEICALYLARPEDMNTTMMGDADMTSWSYPEVKAVNRFKNAFIGQSEYLSSYNKLALVERGTSGVVIVNTGGSYYDGVKAPVHKMASGTYKDIITGNTFTVSGGYIKGDIGDTGIAVVYNADSMGPFTKGEVTDYSVAGTFNDWDTTAHRMVAKDANTATVTMFIEPGTYSFKLTANGLWYGNSGTMQDTTTTSGWTMKSYVDDKCTFVSTGGRYTFTFDITTGKLYVMQYDITDTASTVYLKGDFNDWTTSNQMEYIDNTNTVETAVALSAGTYEFKIHNADMDAWYGNTGTIKDETAETGWTMTAGEDKCTFVASGGVYTFNYNLSTNKLIVAKGEGSVVTYTVTFVDYDGTEISTVDVERGKAATAPEAPTRESDARYSYTFSGWDTDFSNVTSNLIVTAQYKQTVNKFTVTFLDFDGTQLGVSTVEYGLPATVPPVEPSREGYVFTGWSEDVTFVTKDMTVTAVYADAATYLKGSFNSWGTSDLMLQTGTEGVVSATVELEAGTYTFKIHSQGVWYGNTGTIQDTTASSVNGWSMQKGKGNCTLVASGGTYTFEFNTETHRLTVIHDTPVYEVVFKDYDGAVLSSQTVEKGKSALAPENPERESTAQYTYTFAGWDTDFSAVSQDLVVTAIYTRVLNTFTVAFVDYDGKELSSQTVEYGAAAVAPATPSRDGYDFTGWDKDFSSVTENMVVTAKYSKKVSVTTGKISVDITGGAGFKIALNGGALRPQGATYTNTRIPIGTSVTVVANNTSGEEFLGWLNPMNGMVMSKDLSYTFTATGNDFLKASFVTDVEGASLVVFKNDKLGGGLGRILDLQYYIPSDEIVFPDDPTVLGYEFAGWSMTEEEILSAIEAGENVTVVPVWTRVEIKVNVTVVGGSGTGVYNANSAVSVTANEAPEGKKFAYWTDDENNVRSYDETYKFYPAEDTTVTAVFVDENVEIDHRILVFVDYIDTTSQETKNAFGYSWNVPEKYDFVTAGLVAVNKDNYSDATFYAGTDDPNVYTKNPGAAVNVSSGFAVWIKSNVAAGDVWVAKAYVQYRDANGEIITVYSEVAEAVK